MGCVYRAEQVFLQQECALKTLNSRKGSDISMRRFQIEARAASLLNHPNLVKVSDFGLLDDQSPYLVMDFVDGITLSEHLKNHGQLTVDEAAVYFAQACLGLSYAHDQGVVHRDIKPSNLMIAHNLPFATEGSVKVVDFGIAKLTSAENNEYQALTSTGEIFGSPLYMSPEQASGSPVDYRSDIYSLGCVLFEALTGTAPQVGQNALATMMLHQSEPAPTLKEASLGKEFPPSLEQLVAKMLAKSPADRYQNLGVVANDLALISKGVMPQVVLKSSPSKAVKTVTLTQKKFYLLLLSAAIVGAALAGISGYLIGLTDRAPKFKVGPISNTAAMPRIEQSGRQTSVDKKGSPDEGRVLPESFEDPANRIIFGAIKRKNDSTWKGEYYNNQTLLEKTPFSDRTTTKKIYLKLGELLKQLKSDPGLDQSFVFPLQERLVNCCCRLGKFSEAQIRLQECLRIARSPEDEQLVAAEYLLIAQLQLPGGYPKEALAAWLQAASILEKISAKEGAAADTVLKAHLTAANCYRTAGGFCRSRTQDFDKAVEYDRKAKHLFEACGRVNDYNYASTCMGLGASLCRKQRYEEARPILLKALSIFKRICPQDPKNYRLLSNVYSELGAIELASGNRDTARKNFLAAREAVLMSGAKTAIEKKYDAIALDNLEAQLKGLGD